jgi:hypothetical protein
MEKRLAAMIAATAALLFAIFAVPAPAASPGSVDYYDEAGRKITLSGLYYDSNGYPMFNAGCYYTDADGAPVYVGGCRAYYAGPDGSFTAGSYYYDAKGNAVAKPDSYPGGYGCGTYCYDAWGRAVPGAYYYDDFGNPVQPPETTPAPRRGGCCGHSRAR